MKLDLAALEKERYCNKGVIKVEVQLPVCDLNLVSSHHTHVGSLPPNRKASEKEQHVIMSYKARSLIHPPLPTGFYEPTDPSLRSHPTLCYCTGQNPETLPTGSQKPLIGNE
jgi:hypothetical protein